VGQSALASEAPTSGSEAQIELVFVKEYHAPTVEYAAPIELVVAKDHAAPTPSSEAPIELVVPKDRTSHAPPARRPRVSRPLGVAIGLAGVALAAGFLVATIRNVGPSTSWRFRIAAEAPPRYVVSTRAFVRTEAPPPP